MEKTFVCLANSRKLSGGCIAGKLIDTNEWLRPISNRLTEEISEIEMRFENGKNPKLLDIITVKLTESKPNKFQTENFCIDTKYNWAKTGEFESKKLSNLCDNPSMMWTNLNSSYNGRNDRIHINNCDHISHSLILLKLSFSKIIVRTEGAEFNNSKKKVRFQFTIKNIEYILPITDPLIEKDYLGKEDGEYQLNDHYITISLGLPYSDNYCYLFVAGIMNE